MDAHADRIVIIDFGSQYTQLIARRVREAGVYSEIHPWDRADEALKHEHIKGIILSGGPESVMVEAPPRIAACVFESGVPVLGICYGMQAMAQQLGGAVETNQLREYGYARVRARGHTQLLRDIEDHTSPEGFGLLDVWMSHGDRVCTLPPGFITMASTGGSPIAAMADEARRFYGLQFHPEVTHTPQGMRILKRFVHDICGCEARWTTGNIIDEYVSALRDQ
ncbi:MAG: glutamine-hydrolyzing GMP synthase, partial [Pseudomonadota bacterium]|nr:glutamine-hydrolyzing GMP synthase [Pseudomonadota bacterium]